MRNFTLLFLAVLLPLLGNAQSYSVYQRDTINRSDVNGKRQGNWIIFGFMRKDMRYKDSSIMEMGKYIDSKKSGTWLEFYPTGIKKSSIDFVNNRPDGHCAMYFENGGVGEEGTWKGNRWVGLYQKYDERCGNVATETELESSGLIIQRKIYQYDNRCRKMFMVQSMDSTWKAETYDSTGRVIRTQQGKRGTEPEYPAQVVAPKTNSIPHDDGQQVLYNAKKLVSMKGYFVHSRLKDGVQYIYDSNDKLIQIKQYKDYKYVGDLAFDKAK